MDINVSGTWDQEDLVTKDFRYEFTCRPAENHCNIAARRYQNGYKVYALDYRVFTDEASAKRPLAAIYSKIAPEPMTSIHSKFASLLNKMGFIMTDSTPSQGLDNSVL